MGDQPPSDSEGTGAPRIVLPKNIAQTLGYLDESDLGALGGAVEREWQRRRLEKGKVPAEGPKTAPPESPGRDREANQTGSALPLGKASLIRASAQSGMKPKPISRTLRVSLSQVNEVLASNTAGRR